MYVSRARLPQPLLMVLALALAGTGCGTDSRASAARAAAVAFESALRQQHAQALCELIAPGTLDELETAEKSSCDDAIGKQDLPAGGKVLSLDVHGRQARVVLEHDTLFLSQFQGGWKVVAAACRPRSGKPYQCEMKGA